MGATESRDHHAENLEKSSLGVYTLCIYFTLDTGSVFALGSTGRPSENAVRVIQGPSDYVNQEYNNFSKNPRDYLVHRYALDRPVREITYAILYADGKVTRY